MTRICSAYGRFKKMRCASGQSPREFHKGRRVSANNQEGQRLVGISPVQMVKRQKNTITHIPTLRHPLDRISSSYHQHRMRPEVLIHFPRSNAFCHTLHDQVFLFNLNYLSRSCTRYIYVPKVAIRSIGMTRRSRVIYMPGSPPPFHSK